LKIVAITLNIILPPNGYYCKLGIIEENVVARIVQKPCIHKRNLVNRAREIAFDRDIISKLKVLAREQNRAN
jgi:hypothetical protein